MKELSSLLTMLEGYVVSNIGAIGIAILYLIISLMFLPDFVIKPIIKIFNRSIFQRVREFYLEITNVLVKNEYISKKYSEQTEIIIVGINKLQEEKDKLEKSEFLIQSMTGLIKTMSYVEDSAYVYEQVLVYIGCYFEELMELEKVYDNIFTNKLRGLFEELDYIINKDENEKIILSNDIGLKQEDIVNNIAVYEHFVEINKGLKRLQNNTAKKDTKRIIHDILETIYNEIDKINKRIKDLNSKIIDNVNQVIKENV